MRKLILLLLPVALNASFSGVRKLAHPDPPVSGIEFDWEDVDVSSCNSLITGFLLEKRQTLDGLFISYPDDISTASLHCAQIATTAFVHCSVVFRTVKGKHFQMDFTPDPPGNTPEVLLVRCRTIHGHNSELYPRFQDDTGDSAVLSQDRNLGPYVLYPRVETAQRHLDIAATAKTRISIPRLLDVDDKDAPDLFEKTDVDSALATLYYWLQLTPPFFQLLTHDCQTFATTVLGVFCEGAIPLRINNHWGRHVIKRVYTKPAYAVFANDIAEFADDAARTDLENVLMNVELLGNDVEPVKQRIFDINQLNFGAYLPDPSSGEKDKYDDRVRELLDGILPEKGDERPSLLIPELVPQDFSKVVESSAFSSLKELDSDLAAMMKRKQ